MKTKPIIMVCMLAAAGIMAACGGDDLHRDAKKLAQLTVEQMNINKQMQETSNDIQDRYGADDSLFVQFNLVYIEEMLKQDIDDEFRDYLQYMDSLLRNDPSAMSYDEEEDLDFFVDDSLDAEFADITE